MRCIECEEIELARVSDARPSQKMPVPYAALDGFPAGRTPRDLTRRRLLQWGVAGMASIYGAKELGWDTIWESVAAANAAEEKCLVLLYLAGGNDGLNVLIPQRSRRLGVLPGRAAGDPPHARCRPSGTHLGSLPLPGPGGAALAFANPVVSGRGNNGDAIYGLDKLFGDGTGGAGSDLAVMPAVDAKQYNLSHFDNSDIWFKASNDQNVKTGWLGRWIDRNGNGTNPLQAISIDTALSKAIRTQNNPVCAIPSLPFNGFIYSSGGHRRRQQPQPQHDDARSVRRWTRTTTTRTSGARARRTASRSRPGSGSARSRRRPRRRPRRRLRRRSSIRAARSARA